MCLVKVIDILLWNMLICDYKVLEQRGARKVNDGFDERDLSQGPGDTPSLDVELTAQQAEIHRNLESIGPEIAAYYLDGIRILQYEGLETAASLLAHVAREIDGGLRDILAEDIEEDLEFVINTPDDQELKYLKKKEDSFEFLINKLGIVKLTYKNIPGKHKISILQSLGIDDPSPLAERWIDVTKNFAKFAHRRGAWRSPRRIEDFKGLWLEFEGVLRDLVGNYLNLLERLDRIWTAEPTKERRGALHNLLKSEARRAYFFDELKSLVWLEPLKEDGWFDPDRNPIPREDPDQPGAFRIPTWHALEYVVKVSTHSDMPIGVLVDIVNSIINYTDDNGERIENDRTDLQIIKIIATLPTDRIESQHIAFMGIVLKSKWKYRLVDLEIGQAILPKLLDGGVQELTLELLTIMLEVESVDGRIRPIMDVHWLEDTIKKHGQAIAKLCGLEAAQITLEQIRTLANADAYLFNFIQLIESDLSQLSHADYTELIVNFTSCLFQFIEPNSLNETVQVLLNEPHTIIKRIAVKAITDHYSDLKHLFWEWEGNPLDEIELKPEIYQLIQTNSGTFNEDEMEQILQWIESTQH
jgi:hypothetical protein